jgi:hypothetical protein
LAEFKSECDTGDTTADDAGIEGGCRKIWAMLSQVDQHGACFSAQIGVREYPTINQHDVLRRACTDHPSRQSSCGQRAN